MATIFVCFEIQIRCMLLEVRNLLVSDSLSSERVRLTGQLEEFP